jgi:hypothetical protein
MKSQIFLPQKIKVGFQNRSDTYTEKLGYVIYHDGKIWRKEASWESWRDKTDPGNSPLEFDNVPTEGFVLNKKAGGHSWSGWNPRQTYCRVYDPRGFEFEIDIPNLLYILENTSSYVGKGLEGNFVYGWDGKNLVLVPEKAPEYKTMQDYTKKQGISFSKKDLIPGMCYLTKKLEEVLYMGEFKNGTKKSLYFMNIQKTETPCPWGVFIESSSCNFIAEQIGDTPHQEFGELYKMMEDHSDIVFPATKEERDFALSEINPLALPYVGEYSEIRVLHNGKFTEISGYQLNYYPNYYDNAETEKIKKLLDELGLESPKQILESVSPENIFVELTQNANGTGIIFS